MEGVNQKKKLYSIYEIEAPEKKGRQRAEQKSHCSTEVIYLRPRKPCLFETCFKFLNNDKKSREIKILEKNSKINFEK